MASVPHSEFAARVGAGIQHLSGLGSEHSAIICDWLAQLSAAAGDAALTCELMVPGDLDRLVCFVGGDASVVGPLVTDVMEATGASAKEAELHARASAKLKPKHMGTWLEATSAGFDAGWWLRQDKRVDDVRTIVPDSAASELLWDWARDHRNGIVSELRRAFNPATPYTDVTLAVNGDAAKRAGALTDACSLLGLEPFPTQATELTETGTFSVCARLLEEGCNRLAITSDGANADDLSAYADIVSVHTDSSAAFADSIVGTLGQVQIARTNAGLELALRFTLAS